MNDDEEETWLQEKRTYEESKTVHYANDATQTTKGKKAKRKPRRKPEVLRDENMEDKE